MFDYPIGVQLFNRPEYAERLLVSLKNQNSTFDQNRLFIFIDGYRGSSYEARGEFDNTAKVYELATRIFPSANVLKQSQNLGIAALHNLVQDTTFEETENWAAFFEEDVVLDPSYLEELALLIETVNPCELVVKVACFQIITPLSKLPRGYDGFYPGRGTKAFAERKSLFLIKQPMLRSFVEILKTNEETHSSKGAMVVQDSSRLSRLAAPDSLRVLINSMDHDIATDLFIEFNNLLHVVTKPGLAKDIGIVGMHNSITPHIDGASEVFSRGTLYDHREAFEKSLDSIIQESSDYTSGNFKKILDGYYTSLSTKKMLKQISINITTRLIRIKKSVLR